MRRVLAAAVTTAAISTASWGPLPAVGATSAGRTDVPGLEPQLALSVQQATGQQTGSQPTGTDRTSSPSLVPVEVFVTDPAAARASIVSRGGVITGEVPGAVLQARVPAPRVAELTTAAGVHSIRAPRRQQHPQSAASFGPTTGQSPQLSGADAWHTAGIIGTGASVGIIDFFDLRLWNVAEHGPTPSAANGRMFCKDSSGLAPNFCIGPDIDPAQGDGHGVAVAEIVKDMAPGAELYIAQVATLADYRDAIDFFDLKGVNIVTRSLVSPYDGPGDGTGPYGAIVDYAASKGITWFNSAGNEGLDQYMRFAVQDTDGDRLMEFAAGDELLRIDGVPAGGGLFCYTSFGVRWSNDWYNANGTLTDYRVEVYEAANPLAIGTPHTNPTSLAPIDLYPSIPGVQSFVDFNQRSVPSGAKVGVDEDPLEMDGVFWCNTSGVSYLQLRRDANTPVGNPGDVVEVMFYNGLIEADYGTASGAASGPVVDSRNPALVAVGAIDPPASGTIARYSSQGPTIDGRLKPEVAGHACVTSTIFSPCFDGTSSAAPEAAGIAALALSARLAVPGAPLAALVRHYTIDRGAFGPDNVYGFGELRVPAPPPPQPARATGTYRPLTPARILDTRPASLVGAAALTGPHLPGRVLEIPVLGVTGIPATGVSAVAINLASVGAPINGFVQALPTGRAPLGATASLNVSTPFVARSNFAIVPVGVDGTISIYLQAGGHATVDVLGFFDTAIPNAVAAGRFVSIAPERWTNTRDAGLLPEGFAAPRRAEAGETIAVRPLAGTQVDLSKADALVVYVAAASADGGGFLRAQPTGASGLTSATVNYNQVSAAGNTAIIPLGDGTQSISVFTSNSADVFVDVVGIITNDDAEVATAGTFFAITPERVYSTVTIGSPFAAGETRSIQANGPSSTDPQPRPSVAAVSTNLAVAQPGSNGYLKAYASATEPSTASVNFAAGKTTSTGGLVQLTDSDQIKLTTSTNGQVFVDINGYFLS